MYSLRTLFKSSRFVSILSVILPMLPSPSDDFMASSLFLLQTMVAVRRIETYLDEEEVTEQVSSLKKGYFPSSLQSQEQEHEERGLEIKNGTFKWNEVPDESADENRKSDSKNKGRPDNTNNGSITSSGATSPTNPGDETDSASVTSVEAEIVEYKFELKDISVRFPEGELTMVTGPTASGKTALLVRTPPSASS